MERRGDRKQEGTEFEARQERQASARSLIHYYGELDEPSGPGDKNGVWCVDETQQEAHYRGFSTNLKRDTQGDWRRRRQRPAE